MSDFQELPCRSSEWKECRSIARQLLLNNGFSGHTMMDNPVFHGERRLDRRIPIGCAAVVRRGGGEAVPAMCVALSVRGMTIHAAYVPGEAEVIDVEVKSATPLVVCLAVKRCHALGGGLYEIGGEIVRVIE